MKFTASIFTASLFAVTMAAAAAHAATKSYGVSAGVSKSDNIARAPANEQSETMLTAGLDFALAEQTAKIRASASADLSYIDYRDSAFDSEVVGQFSGEGLFRFVPERFEWFVQDNFGQTRRDPFTAVTPANRENINYFTTGPDLGWRFFGDTRGKLSGRYSNIAYEDSPFDSDRLGGALSLLHDLSAATTLSLTAQAEKNEYDDALLAANDFDRRDLFAGYSATLSRTSASIELGYSIISRDNVSEDAKSVLARLNVRRKLTQRSTLSVTAGHEFSDAGNSFRMQQGLGGVDLNPQSVLQTVDPFTSRHASLGWDLTGRRTRLGADVGVFDEDYEQQISLDRRRTVASAYISRDLMPNLTAQLHGSVSKEEFDNVVNSDFRESVASASISWRVGRRVSFTLQFDRADRSSDNAATEYTENRGWLQVRFGEGIKGVLAEMGSPSSRSSINPGT